ncbi:hypothetical protein [Streptomyces sp. NPDC058653]|uniref:hypothetical protein n=1 Tax=Streptomyces sp. NPDC058653 TaxID=3346576 RepID=UPI00365BFC0D
MSEVELAAQAVVAGVTVGLTETVQSGARDAWGRLISLVRRDRSTTADEEQPTTHPREESASADEPDRGVQAGKYTVFLNDAKGVLLGDNARQNNHFH